MRFLYQSFFRDLAQPVLGLPRICKRLIVLLVDAALCIASTYSAFYLRLGYWIGPQNFNFYDPLIYSCAISLVLALPIFILSGLYLAIFRYSGLPALITVTKAVCVYGLIYALIIALFGIEGIPRTVGLLQPLLLLLAVGASRAFANVWLGGAYLSILKNTDLPRVLIYGAGSAGRQLAAGMANSHEMIITGFLDDDPRLQGHLINGLKIYKPENMQKLVKSLRVSTILLALPSLTQAERNLALKKIEHAKVLVRTLPGLMDLAQGRVTIADLKELDIDDLLARDVIEPDQNLLLRNVAGQVVLITGAGGSIGGELCQQILSLEPKVLLLVEQSEFALYELHQKLTLQQDNMGFSGLHSEPFKSNANSSEFDISRVRLFPLLASVQDEVRMRYIISNWRPHIIYHAAAYKHVPIVEHNPAEGIRNNVLGTLRVATIAAEEGVANFVLISTDKAVRPTNIMGASKRLAEMVLQAFVAEFPGTQFSMVRFGNVLGSSGSVVPKFRQQIKDGGPIQLTHLEATRYFMTIPEAAQLVIQAGAIASGGEVFLLDMGQPVKILDLARRMVTLSGLSLKDDDYLDGDIEIEVTGLRPGEKLYEELLIGDKPELTCHPLIMKASEEFLPWNQLSKRLKILEIALDANDIVTIKALLQELVSGYISDTKIVDWVYLSRELGT
jgi:FlaA1/EpsC-like NDP-sugar epimerase